MLIRLLLLMIVLSCGKNLSIDSVNQYGQIRKSDACPNVDLNQNYLDQKNFLAIYQCLGWHQSAPAYYKYVQEFNSDDWNDLFFQINQDFFGINSKKNIFDYLLTLRNSNQLLNLQNYLYLSANRDNSFSLFRKIKTSLSQKRNSEQELISYTNLVGIIDLYDELMSRILENKNKFIEKTIYNENEIEKDLIALVDLVVKDRDGKTDKLILDISNFLVGVNEGWFEKSFLQTPEKLPDTIQYVKTVFPQMKLTIAAIRSLLAKEETVCFAGEDKIIVNHKEEVLDKLNFVIKNNLNDFLYELNDLVLKYGFWREVCSQDEAFLEDLNTINDTLVFVSEFVAKPERFELFISLLYSLSEKNIENYDYLLKFLLSPELESFINFVDKYLNQNEEFSDLIVMTLSSLDKTYFKRLATLLKDMVIEKNEFIDYFFSLWNILKTEEKKDLIYILFLSLYEKEQSLPVLTHFFLYLSKAYPDEMKNAYQKIRDSYKDENLFDNIFLFLNDKILFSELKTLIKENGLISLINLVLPTEKKLENRKPLIKIQEVEHKGFESAKEVECTNDLIRENLKGRKFSEMIQSMPESCRSDNTSFMSKVYKAIKKINTSSVPGEVLFGANGVFTSEFLKLHAALFLTKDLTFAQNPSYQESLFEDALDQIKEIYLEAKKYDLVGPVLMELARSFAETGISEKNNKIHFNLSKSFHRFDEKSLIESLISTFNKNDENVLTKKKHETRYLYFDLITFIELLYDFTDPTLKEKVLISKNGVLHELELTPLEMIEYSFENMKFAHNHYAAVAANSLGYAFDFDRELNKFQKNLKRMRFSFSFFARFNYVEYEDRENINNLNETFKAFWHLENKRPEFGKQSYVDLIQNLLKTIVDISSAEQKNLKLLSKPKEETEHDHAISALIEIMEGRVLSQLATFLKDNIALTKEEFFSGENLKLFSFIQESLQDEDSVKKIISILNIVEKNNFDISTDLIAAGFYALKILTCDNDFKFIDLLNMDLGKWDSEMSLDVISPLLATFLKSLSKNENFKHNFKSYYEKRRLVEIENLLTKIDWNKISPIIVSVENKSSLLKIINSYQYHLEKAPNSSFAVYQLLDGLMGDTKHYPLKDVLLDIFVSEGESLFDFLERMRDKVTVLIQ